MIPKRKPINDKPKSAFDIVHMTPAQVKEVKRDVADLKKMLREDQQRRSPKIIDRMEFAEDIRRKEKMIADHSPRDFRSKAEENKAFAYAKKLGDWISNQMPSTRAYYQEQPKEKDRYGNPIIPDHNEKQAFEKTVEQQMHFQTDKRCIEAVNRYKNIMRRLDPLDPTITNIELLRR